MRMGKIVQRGLHMTMKWTKNLVKAKRRVLKDIKINKIRRKLKKNLYKM